MGGTRFKPDTLFFGSRSKRKKSDFSILLYLTDGSTASEIGSLASDIDLPEDHSRSK